MQNPIHANNYKRWCLHYFTHKSRTCSQGQGGILVLTAVVLISLLIIGVAVNQSGFFNAKQVVNTQQNLQTYYVAMAGVQESLASRMVPRTNYYSLVNVNNIPSFIQLSGKVYQDPINNTGLLGYYRTLILGGDPSVNPQTGQYDPTYDLGGNGLPAQSFYVLSKGSTCRSDPPAKKVAIGIITLSAQGVPTCPAGYGVDELTIVSRLDMSRGNIVSCTGQGLNCVSSSAQAPPGTSISQMPDIVINTRTYKTSTNIPIDTPVIPPGGSSPVSTVNFESIWQETTPISPVRIVFYSIDSNTVRYVHTVSGTAESIPATNYKATLRDGIRVKFNKPFDYRSLFYNPSTPGASIADCKNNPATCSIRLRNLSTNALYGGARIIPVFPSNTEVLFFPPSPNSPGLNTGTPYRLELTGIISDYKGNTLNGGSYTLTFQTQ